MVVWLWVKSWHCKHVCVFLKFKREVPWWGLKLQAGQTPHSAVQQLIKIKQEKQKCHVLQSPAFLSPSDLHSETRRPQRRTKEPHLSFNTVGGASSSCGRVRLLFNTRESDQQPESFQIFSGLCLGSFLFSYGHGDLLLLLKRTLSIISSQ